jgi:hypothetical protein
VVELGRIEDDLKGKMLGAVADPIIYGQSRMEETYHVSSDIVLAFDNWRDNRDEEGNEMVWLEVECDETPFDMRIVDRLDSRRLQRAAG